MHIIRDLRRRFHYYRYEDLPPETQEALDQCDEFERLLAEEEARVVSKGIKGRRYELYESPRYIRDREYLEKNGYDLADLDKAIVILLDGERLPRSFKPHKLKGKRDGLWDCHIKDDWILLYRCNSNGIVLEAVRTSSHRNVLRI